MSEALYAQYRHVLKALPFDGVIMPYGWGDLPKPLGVQWMAYSEMFDEFARELANIINVLTDHVARLSAWGIVTADLDDEGKLAAAHEFIDDVATISLNLPYVIRSRFYFAAAHLSHQANQLKYGQAWQDDLPLDNEIYQEAFDRHVAPWGRRYVRLKTRLERIGGQAYQTATHDFRNAYNHRFSPRFLVGMTNIVTREVSDDGGVGYSFGGLPPLDLAEMAGVLKVERDASYAAFVAFQTLVRDHEKAIAADMAKET